MGYHQNASYYIKIGNKILYKKTDGFDFGDELISFLRTHTIDEAPAFFSKIGHPYYLLKRIPKTTGKYEIRDNKLYLCAMFNEKWYDRKWWDLATFEAYDVPFDN